MADSCVSFIRGRVMRVTKLDACGNPVPGAHNKVVTKGFISVALTANTDEGTAITVQNANGDNCINDVPAPKFTGYGIEVQYCGVDPVLYSLMSGQATVKNAAGDNVGFRVNTQVDLDSSAFAIELWSTVPGASCGETGLPNYGYFLIPFVKGGVLGDFTVANDAVNFTLTGAQSKDGNAWGVGPYDVVLDEGGDAGPLLVALDENDHLDVEVTQVPPPTAVCGGTEVGTIATLITAGIPAALTPTNGYLPDNLADLQASSIVKAPTTAWTTGQYVLLPDGSKAHWSSTAWVAGPA